MLVGVFIPWIMLLSARVRRTRWMLFIACFLIIGGVALNRVNVFLVGFQPPYAERSYFPAIGEMAVTAAMIAGLMLVYRICVTYFPVLSSRGREVSS
jgi:Ni/Fe-hydrogenase subunit HybB-like protein